MRSNPLRYSLDTSRFAKYPEANNTKELKLQIIELQTSNQNYKERIRLLERQIEELNVEISGLLKLNRKLANSYGSVQLQELEQVCEGIYKKQMNESFEQIDQLQIEIEKFRNVIQMLREENAGLRTKILQYRKYVAQLSSQELPVYVSTTVDVPKSVLESLSGFNKSKTVKDAFDCFSGILKPVSLNILIFVNSQSLFKLYNRSCPKERTKVGRMFLLVHGDLTKENAIFSNKDEILTPSQKKDYLLVPSYLNKDLDYIVQCSQPVKSCFTDNDLQIVIFLVSYMNRLLKFLLVKSTENLRKNILQKTLKLIGLLVTAKSLDCLANLVDEHLAGLFDFQEAGIVFIDHKAESFFIYGYSPKPDVKYCNEIIRLPFSMGFTGEVLRGNELKTFENLKNKAGFCQEIDNVASTGDIKQCVMIKLKGPEGIVTGILQLNNKNVGKVTKSDLKLIEEMAEVLGHIIFGIGNFEEAFDLTFKLKSSLSILQQ